MFGTVAADGRAHAHRVYLSSDGTSKAELGETAEGKPRDPKKSARTADGQPSTAGCGVVWGDVERADHCVVVEGIENGCSVAYALREESKPVRSWSCRRLPQAGSRSLSWPATKKITVAADRDELRPAPAIVVASGRRGRLASAIMNSSRSNRVARCCGRSNRLARYCPTRRLRGGALQYLVGSAVSAHP